MIDVEKIKEQILSILNQRGPSLPVEIAREIKLSPIFTSAILSELANAKKVKLSSLKVGSSPLYFIPGQEKKLEQHADNLEGFAKSAFLKLKQNKILDDEKQEPAIRVALRSIKDFAIPFKLNNKIFWRYAFISEEEFQEFLNKKRIETLKAEEDEQAIKEQVVNIQAREPTVGEKISASTSKLSQQPEPIFIKQKTKRKIKTNFLEEIKNFLNQKNIQLLNTEKIDKKEITAVIKVNEEPCLLIAFNKKRISEKEILKSYRKAKELNLPYYILTKGEPTKKMREMISAYKNLKKIDKIEQ